MIELNDIDAYAAEYVLGTLDLDERDEMTILRNSNSVVARAITAWESRLTPLSERIPNEMPSPDLLSKIEMRIVSIASAPEQPTIVPSMQRWQALMLTLCLLLVMATVTRYVPHSVQSLFSPTAPSFVAVLQSDPFNPLFVITINSEAKSVGVRRLMAATPADKDYELWIILQGEKEPRPMGVMSNEDIKLPMIEGLTSALLLNATVAVSVEPHGGSPTGLPTGPVIVTGKLVQTSL